MTKRFTNPFCRILLGLLSFLLAPVAPALSQSVTINGPAGSGAFGTSVLVLPNGNIVVTDPLFDQGTTQRVGAIYLYNGKTNALISTLTGSQAGDLIGNGTVTLLTNGNYVVSSPYWQAQGGTSAGAVTWGSATTGVSGTVSAANSLVGSHFNDRLGLNLLGVDGITALPNGNYVVSSPSWTNGSEMSAGAATWGNGSVGTSGVVSAANSLVGTHSFDQVSSRGIVVLTNGHYVVCSRAWDNGSEDSAGAATWGNGSTGISGVVSAANSLVGTQQNDGVGSSSVALSNGNYVVSSPNWSNGSVHYAGAATWGNGSTGIRGAVSTVNSLVGTKEFDSVSQSGFFSPIAIGKIDSKGIIALPNGSYVVSSSFWDNGAVSNAGAVTWCTGTTSTSAAVSAANSLIGAQQSSLVSSGGILALTNGNFVVFSPEWNNGSVTKVGAVTWVNGSAGTSGVVSAANSLVGTQQGDGVGFGGVALSNGNYVVRSPTWSNGAVTSVGAATWGNGSTGIRGAVSSANSLVGTQQGDDVSRSGIKALPNGHYVVGSYNWVNGTMKRAGAATWGNGNTGISGAVSVANSLVGTQTNDFVSFTFQGYYSGIDAMPDGNYVVTSTIWNNGAIPEAGALTLGNGTTGIVGLVSACNSIVGSIAGGGRQLTLGYNATTHTVLGGLPAENKIVIGFGPSAAPTGPASQPFSTGATVANLAATGTAIQWYAAATGGTALAPTTPLVSGVTYYASQTVRGCESTTRLAVKLVDALATAAPSKATVRVFPNPIAKGRELTVLVPAVGGATQVEASLVNPLGQVVRQLPAVALPAAGARLQVPTAGLAAGVYVLRLVAGPTPLSVRVLVE